MEFKAAQSEMARAHVGGAPGVLASGIAWLAACIAWQQAGTGSGFTALFIGGLFIVPVALLISRLVFRAPPASPTNPLQRLGLEATFFLFAGLAIAYAALPIAPDLTIPAFAIVIGARYTSFNTIYDDKLYWLLGGLIAATGGLALFKFVTFPGNPALVVGAVELAMAGIILARHLRQA